MPLASPLSLYAFTISVISVGETCGSLLAPLYPFPSGRAVDCDIKEPRAAASGALMSTLAAAALGRGAWELLGMR